MYESPLLQRLTLIGGTVQLLAHVKKRNVLEARHYAFGVQGIRLWVVTDSVIQLMFVRVYVDYVTHRGTSLECDGVPTSFHTKWHTHTKEKVCVCACVCVCVCVSLA